jgi:hypothetical protein
VLKFDSSNTQYGALGLRAASRLGFPVKETTWYGLTRHFEIVRERKGPRAALALVREDDPAPTAAGGTAAAPPAVTVPEVTGFLYSTRETRPWLSMVCAGIASLELARHELLAARSPKATATFVAEVEARVLSVWAWLDAHWAVDRNAEHPGLTWPYYALYALERAAIFSRVRTVGGRDWYFEGAVQILLRRHKDGHWDEAGTDKTIGTCTRGPCAGTRGPPGRGPGSASRARRSAVVATPCRAGTSEGRGRTSGEGRAGARPERTVGGVR